MSQHYHCNGYASPEVNSKSCRKTGDPEMKGLIARNRKTIPQAHTAELQRKRGARHAHACVHRTRPT
eukprot:1793817-Prymnesium_polylepis.1